MTERIVDPYFIIFRARAFYFVAWCHRRKLFRTFRLDRVREIEITPDSFTRDTSVNAQDYFKGSWEVFGGEPVDVVVRFKGAAARVVKGSQHQPDEEIETVSDDEIIYHVRVNGLFEIKRWIVGCGDQAEVLSPDILRDELKGIGEYLRGVYEA